MANQVRIDQREESFQKFAEGSLDVGGYSVSKTGNIVLTRMFPDFKPRPSDNGVKAYAICPSVVPTDMNIGEAGVEDREEAMRIFAKMARERNYGTRALVKEEVGEAMMHSLRKERNSLDSLHLHIL